MKILKIVLVLVLFVIALALGAQNQEVVNFNYLIAQGQFHLSTLLGIVFLAAFLLAWAIFGTLLLKAKFTNRKLTRQLNRLKPGTTSTSTDVAPANKG